MAGKAAAEQWPARLENFYYSAGLFKCVHSSSTTTISTKMELFSLPPSEKGFSLPSFLD
jgi:hypothetical protein